MSQPRICGGVVNTTCSQCWVQAGAGGCNQGAKEIWEGDPRGRNLLYVYIVNLCPICYWGLTKSLVPGPGVPSPRGR